jgi:hypothetical protein
VKTPRKQASPCTIDVRLPRETIQHLRKIARLAKLTVDQVVAVIIATKIVQTREKGGG